VRELPTGTVTFLFTDVEASTRLLHELGTERYGEALAEHRRVLREAFAAHGGVEVDTQGDALFVAFARASEAAAAAQRGHAALGDTPIRVRMGLHTGEADLRDEGYVGMDVHLGARIAAGGHGGQTLVSEQTARLLGDAPLRDLGLHRLKDVGEVRVYQLGTGDFPPLATLHQLHMPTPATPLVGRMKELVDVARLLTAERARVVTLTGPGGTGKTRFSIAAAEESLDAFSGGVWFVDLSPVRDPALVVDTIGSSLGAKVELREHIGDRELLLVLDNLEQVVGAAGDLAGLVGSCPSLQLLCTSREPLRIAAEHEYPLRPLPESPAIELFRQRVRSAGFTAEVDYELAAAICERLDRLPLAIELAAARVKVFEPLALLERLERRLPLLTSRSRDLPARQRTLHDTIAWSYELLDGEEQQLFRRLAVFAGGATLAAVEAVCEGGADLMEALVDKSLLRRRGDRFLMLETIREFALERLGDSSERDAVAEAHFDSLLSLAEEAQVKGEAYGAGWLDRLDAERDNFRAALRWCLDEGRPVLALRLAGSLGRFWVIRGHAEGYRWLRDALEAAVDAPADLRAVGLMWAQSTVFFTGDFERAGALGQEALELFRELGDKENIARELDRLAGARAAQGDLATARAHADESLALFRELGDRAGSMYPLSKVAWDERLRGDRDLGDALMEDALGLAREAGDTWWAAGLLVDLAETAWERGDLGRAATLGRESLSLAHELGNAQTLVYGFGLLAALAAAERRELRAGRLWGAVEAIEASGEARIDPKARASYEQVFLALSGPDFELGLREARATSLDEAVAHALADA
jgi:predicted ATPase